MIDRGQRLLFLDNYSGAWDSYLNEFIDLQAVKGLNAIWSNTFLKVGTERYNFPPTRSPVLVRCAGCAALQGLCATKSDQDYLMVQQLPDIERRQYQRQH